MPTLHRLATLRDDVIYFIALYQSWVYRVDHRRVNEFGQGGDGESEKKEIEGVKTVVEEKKEPIAASSGADKKKEGATKRR